MKQPLRVEKLRKEVYDHLKVWDKKREQKLKKHLEIVEEITENIETKIEDSRLYMNSVEDLFKNRLKQLKTYAAKSLQNSEFVLPKNKSTAYQPHYNLLKAIMIDESNNTEAITEKISKLRTIYQTLSGFKEEQLSTQKKNFKDESSIVLAKGNIRYMIECELGQVIEKVTCSCQKVSKIYHNEEKEDLYLAILSFLAESRRQEVKHRQIGKQLISLVSTSLKRQMTALHKIKQCLKEWISIDVQIEEVFLQQLQKKDDNPLIKDFYDLSTMTDTAIRDSSVQYFLTSFTIDEFDEVEKLKLCELDGFFNKKIQANVVMTVDKYVHLLRLNSLSPDFSFMLNQNLHFKKEGESTVDVSQFRKKFYFKKQKQFGFSLQFNNKADLQHFETFAIQISECQFT